MNTTHCADCGKLLDPFGMCPDISPLKASRAKSPANCGRPRPDWLREHNRKTNESRSYLLSPRSRSTNPLKRLLSSFLGGQ